MTDFYKKLESKLIKLELERREIKKQFLYLLVFILAGWLFILIFLLKSGFPTLETTLILTFLLIFLGIYVYSIFYENWSEIFKSEVINLVFENFFPELKYEPNGFIDEGMFVGSMLFVDFPLPDRYRGEDLIEGEVEGVPFKASEIHAEYKTEHTDTKGRRREQWHTIFKGLFFIAKFPKKVNGVVLVYPNEIRLIGNPGKLDRVKLEDPEFESLFDVFSNDQIEARYVLSLSMMKRITDFSKKHGVNLRLSFISDNMFCGIEDYSILQAPGLFQSVLPYIYRERFKNYIEEINFIKSLIEDLKLNQRLWKEP